MKKYMTAMVVVLTVLALAWTASGQRGARQAQRRGQGRGGFPGFQMLSPEEAAKLRERWPNMSEEEKAKLRAQWRERWQNMSDEEKEKFRAQMRERFAGRRALGREGQLEAIAAIEEQVAKLKAAVESMSRPDREQYRQLSEEERNKLREKMRQTMRERREAIAAIEQQLATLKGPRQTGARQGASIGELKSVHDLAVKENAEQTAERLEKLITRYQRAPEARSQQRGQRRPARDGPRRDRPARGQEGQREQ